MGAAKPDLAEQPIEVAKIWKSPRNKRHTIHFALREYDGHPYVDVRTHALNAKGEAKPTKAGVTVTHSRFAEFVAAAVKTLAKAREIGLINDDESAK